MEIAGPCLEALLINKAELVSSKQEWEDNSFSPSPSWSGITVFTFVLPHGPIFDLPNQIMPDQSPPTRNTEKSISDVYKDLLQS